MVKIKGDEMKQKEYLPERPVVEDMLRFCCKKIKTKRLRKKFLANPEKYAYKYIMKKVWMEFVQKQCKMFGEAFGEKIWFWTTEGGSIISPPNSEGFMMSRVKYVPEEKSSNN